MFAFFILLVIAIALIQKHRYTYLKNDRMRRYYRIDRGERFKRDADSLEREIKHRAFSEAAAADSISRYSDKLDRAADRLNRKADKFRRRYEDRAERHAEKFERRAGLPPAEAEEQRFKTEAERQAYRRARKQATREAGFYGHLMWYGTVIGFLFLINLLTGSYPWFLWPALVWGFGLMSHFSAVFGWRWIHERVFEPAIQREVQREVMHEKEVLHTEKQASLDELTATFAHEIRNPIAAAKSLVQQMGEDPTSNENVEYAKVALEELARVERSVSHLLKYAKEEDYHFDNVSLSAVLDSALTQMRPRLESHQVTVSRNYLGGPAVRADADKLRQVFSNVIDNAVDAMESVTTGRRLELAIHNAKNSGFARVLIKDTGCGIAPDKLGKIFNPFYTSKANGTGLGMAVARKVVEAHRGSIEVHSRPGAGTEFEIAIPLSDAAREERAEGQAAPAAAASSARAAQE